MKAKKFLLLCLLFILVIPDISYGANDAPKVYLIVINKLTLKDIESMNNLNRIIEEGSIGLMNTRGVSGYTGAESFLTINASRKANSNYTSVDFRTNKSNGFIVNDSFSSLINLNKDNKFSPHIGAMGDNLHRIGLKTGIYGNSDLIDKPLKTSALIPMDSMGLIDYGNIDNITIEENNYPFFIKTDYEKLSNEVKNSSADFIVGDTGDLERLYRYSKFLSDNEFLYLREKILMDIDKFIGNLSSTLEGNNSLLIITSPNNGDKKIDDNKLSPIVLWGKEIEKGTLISKTTNREGLVTNIDIGPTIMNFLGADTNNMSGSRINSISKNISLEDIIKYSQQINTISKVRYNTLYLYGIFSIIILILSIIFLSAKIRLSEKTKDIIKILFTMILTIPSIFIIASIFKPKEVYSFISILLILSILSLFIIWKTRKNNNQIIYIMGISVFIIMMDLLLKGNISKFSVLSHDPVIGARYYGIGNEMVGLFLGLLSVLSVEILRKNNKSILPLILLGMSAILIGHPRYGVNVGGTMAFIVAIVFYVMETFNRSLSIKIIFLMGVIIILFVSIMGYIDIRFNDNITHLGNTTLLIKSNGLKYLNQIAFRKLFMNIKLMENSFWIYLLLLHMILHVLIFYFKGINSKISIANIAGLSGAIGDFLFNDSGLILAAICMNLITSRLYLEYIE